MEMYKVLMEINRRMLLGEEISSDEKEEVVSVFLNGVYSEEDIMR